MGGFATGVAVVTTDVDGIPHGMTVNSLTSVSLDPPLLLVSMVRHARTTDAVLTRSAFCVNMLSERQVDLSARFARSGEDHFADIAAERTPDGLPLLPKTLGWAECTIEQTHPVTDHVLVIGQVRACAYREGLPLVFYRGRYHHVSGEGRDAGWYW
ncbi:MAG: flavin reductase family protein [Streptosporangiaceae bacterium]